MRRTSAALGMASAPAVLPDIGDIALVDDSEGVVVHPNPFDLQQLTLHFSPGGPDALQYTAATAPLNFDAAAAAAGTPLAGLGDDDTRIAPLPFPFPFFGQRYTSIYINSDGNLTFAAGDASSDPRSVGRAISGPPRIFVLFDDLDPSQPGAAVGYFAAADRAVVTWNRTPEFSETTPGARQTFQAVLYPDGRIDFNYQTIAAGTAAVVGIASGLQQNGFTAVDFSAGIAAPAAGALAEVFSNRNSIDFIAVSRKFYRNHQDAYDYIILFNTLGFTGEDDPGAFSAERNIRNQVRGIGGLLRQNSVFDDGLSWGSPLRLQSFVNMGPLSNFPANPTDIIPAFAASRNTPLSILGQESGHRFLAYVRYLDPLTRQPSSALLGRANAHWSFFFNSDASVVEGNRIQDLGAGQSPRFLTIGTVEHYSALDQYLMGLRGPDDVPASFLVRNPSIPLPPASAPQPGIRFDGTRQDITLQMITDAEGKRIPDWTVAQKHFNFAFVLLVPGGSAPPAGDVAKVDQLRQAWGSYFAAAVDHRGTAEVRLVKALLLSTWPAGGVVQGSPATATVSVAAPLASKLDVMLSADSSVITIPPSVTIPAGAVSASFSIVGNRAGTAALSARAADASYEVAQTIVQVREGASRLHLDLVSGGGQQGALGQTLPEPIVLRLHDDNDVPFSGVPVDFAASGDGVITPSRALTDAAGQVRVSWRLASSGAFNSLTASPEGAASAAVVVSATGLAQPAFSAAGVVNAAALQPMPAAAGISPGSLATVFGASLAAGTFRPSSLPLPVNLGSTQVAINGRPAPLLYVSPGQINLQVPFDVSGTEAEIVVSTPAGLSLPVKVPVVDIQPGIFFDPATGLGAILLNSNGASTAVQPARVGDFLQIYATGLGPVSPAAVAGFPAPSTPLVRTATGLQVTIAGLPAPVVFAGLAPGFAGLYQVNVQVPEGVPPGRQNLVVSIKGLQSNTVQVNIGP